MTTNIGTDLPTASLGAASLSDPASWTIEGDPANEDESQAGGSGRPSKLDRNTAMFARYRAGATYSALGREFGITPGRVRIIIERLEEEAEQRAAAARQPQLISEPDVTARVRMSLRAAGLRRWADILAMPEAKLDRIPGIGPTTARELIAIARERGHAGETARPARVVDAAEGS